VQTIGGLNNGKPGETAQRATQPTVKPDGSAGSKETQTNLGGGIFDPARWKTSVDARLDPKAKIQSSSQTKIEVRKPPADHYVRVHADPAFNGIFPLYSDSMAKRFDPHLVAPELELPPQVGVNVKLTRLAVTITDTGRLFLWHVAQTGSDWHESGDGCILTAMTRWVKVIPDGSGYRMEFPSVELPEPAFPDWNFSEYLARAFAKDRYMDSHENPEFKRLAGIR
jgi:hypothetical protein